MRWRTRTKALAAERDALRESAREAKANVPRPEFKIHVKDQTAALNALKVVDANVREDFREQRDTFKASETGQALRELREPKENPFRQDLFAADSEAPFAPEASDPFAPAEKPIGAPSSSLDPGLTSYQRAVAEAPSSGFSTFA